MNRADGTLQNLIYTIEDEGCSRQGRGGIGTRSIFGAQVRFDLRNGMPVVSNKLTNWRAAFNEMLWFLRGESNTKTLGSRIWDQWASEEGDLGFVYGPLWRGTDATPPGQTVAATGTGHDQVVALLDEARKNPYSRRLIVSGWLPGWIEDAALPPCHTLWQIYLNDMGHLDLHLYQRSADLMIGVPFNWAQYALLAHILGGLLCRTPRHLIVSYGDLHIYDSHKKGVEEYSNRSTWRSHSPLPTLTTSREIRAIRPNQTSKRALEELLKDPPVFGLANYEPLPVIKFPVEP